MRALWRGITRVVFWSYERGTWPYDLMVVAIVVFVLLTPARWFKDQPPSGAPLGELLARSPATDWRPIDPANTLYLTLPQGRVIIELAPGFAPRHVANLKRLVRAHFFDGLFATWFNGAGKR